MQMNNVNKLIFSQAAAGLAGVLAWRNQDVHLIGKNSQPPHAKPSFGMACDDLAYTDSKDRVYLFSNENSDYRIVEKAKIN